MVVTCFFVICTFGAIKFKQPERHMDERDNEGKNPSCLLSQTCHQKETRRLYGEDELKKSVGQNLEKSCNEVDLGCEQVALLPSPPFTPAES